VSERKKKIKIQKVEYFLAMSTGHEIFMSRPKFKVVFQSGSKWRWMDAQALAMRDKVSTNNSQEQYK
jgi:hypothetical protein